MIFVENINQYFYVTIAGLVLIAITAVSKSFLGNNMAFLINFIGALFISYSIFIIISQLVLFYTHNPTFLTDEKYDAYRINIYMSLFLCVTLIALIIYSTYSIFISDNSLTGKSLTDNSLTDNYETSEDFLSPDEPSLTDETNLSTSPE